MNGFERRTELIKEKIKKTVLSMLKTWEPKKIRIADIAAEAGVSQVTIYNYFGSKEALLSEVFKQFINKSIMDFEAFIQGDHSLKEIIQYIVFADKEAYRAFTPQAFSQFLKDEETHQYVEELYRTKGMPLVVQFIEEGKRKGEISAKVSTPTIIAYINMLKAQSHMFLDLAQQSEQVDDFLDEFIHLFFYGICSSEPESDS
ncbi:AcrR family transcriptional regulator [Paenibacillus castaneae]|uniref:TetR/AcrR family transcriptional regulator n=1 Tax=Paenibacillus castaneae TaxID=474957 RepID=UPI000C99A586|nr:TetR/AcrR family transcriptional regulator [Paenibacillus castaneae]NIK80416.1 AcrR family transcriptional regulator [Paenibacillus castaneae]